MSIIKFKITHCLERDRPKGLTLTVACSTNLFGILMVLVKTSIQALRLALKGFVLMLFKEKTKIEYQLEEYIEWKSARCMFQGAQILSDFVYAFKYVDVKDITYDDLYTYKEKVQEKEVSMHTIELQLKTIRCFLRYFKARKYPVINPEWVQIDFVVEDGTIENMKEIKREKVGRPVNEEAVKQVRFLKDKGGLSLNAIARAWQVDLAQVSRWYNYKDKTLVK